MAEKAENDELVDLLFKLFILLQKDIMKAHPNEKDLGIGNLEYGLLGILSKCGSIRPSVAAERLSMARPQMTVIIDRLEKRGFIARESDPDDRRSFILTLAGEGKANLTRATNEMRKRIGSRFSGLEPEELTKLKGALGVVATTLEKTKQSEEQEHEC